MDPFLRSGDYTPIASAAAPRQATLTDELAGLRLDQALARVFPQFSRSRLQQWLAAGFILVNGARREAREKVIGGERIEVMVPPLAEETAFAPEDIPLPIVFEDEAVIVIDKPAGLVVHPGSGNWSGTLLNALLQHAPQLAGVPRAGIVHRLDKDTTGLLVVAKTLEVQTALVRMLQGRKVTRIYLALAHGRVAGNGRVEAPIGRHPVQRVKMAVVSHGKPALTEYSVERCYAQCSLLRCRLHTGRTHQIRVHLASIGHPLVGDSVYGRRNAPPEFHRQALHATHLALEHPLSGVPQAWNAPLPPDFAALLAQLDPEEPA
jgi:23S rRNA pseudouridine1911/1915/1917 synthase